MKNKGKQDDPLYRVVGAAYEKHKDQGEISPSWLATLAMVEIGFGRDLHELGYIGCHLHLRQVARYFCGKKFDPEENIEDDLFPETLQQRYPKKPTDKDSEPVYILLDLLSDDDVKYNVARLRKESSAKLKHADALEAWGRSRGKAA